MIRRDNVGLLPCRRDLLAVRRLIFVYRLAITLLILVRACI